jgi:type I restriction enzyme, S subunit
MNWRPSVLGDHIDILSGFAFKSQCFNSDGRGLPLVRIRDVVPGKSDTFYDGPYGEQYIVSDGDLLIGMDGEFNRARWRGGPSLLNQRVCRVRPSNGCLDEGYLYHALPQILKKLEAQTPFVTVKHLSANDLRQVEIPLPPLEEQKRIAAFLDKAVSIENKRCQIAKEADALLRATFLDMFGHPATLAGEHPLLSDVADVSRGRFSPRPRNDPTYYDGEFPFIQTGEIAAADGYLSDFRQTLNGRGIKVSKKFPAGTVFIAIVGATIGATAVSTRDFWCPDSVIGMVPKSKSVPSEFLEYLLRFWKPIFLEKAPETARPNINLQTLKPICIPGTGTNKPLEFARVYRSVHRIKSQSKSKSQELLSCLIQRVFAGNL